VRFPKKSAPGHVTPNLCFCIWLDLWGHAQHSVATGARNMIAIFFILWGDRYGFDKKHTGTRYVEHVFLHLVASVGYVVYFGRSGAQNIDALFFMLGRDWHGFDKGRVGTRYVKLVFLHPLESACYVGHSSGS
jgi:hypothetical protein